MVRSFFFIPSRNRFEKIFFHEILYIQVCMDTVQIVTENSVYKTDVSIDKLQKSLPSESFCRINSSCIISIEKIISFDKKLVHMPGVALPVEDGYRSQLQDQVMILDDIRNRGFRASYMINSQGLLIQKGDKR